MAKKTVQLPTGQFIEAEVIGFKVTDEPWSIYELEDGTKVRMKLVVSEIYRLDGQYTPEGDTLYLVKSSNVVSTEVPDNLRRRPTTGQLPKPGTYL